ncbi:MAG: alpha-1,2-fucosyltransferase [Alphaproteobacteria bacterium]|nr:alpha-1,2-fucosyltransferase [Alphaproteobacteria bacterium]
MAGSRSIVSIMGGLGNQMFQYSLGTYVAQVLGQQVVFNGDALAHYQDRPLALNLIGLETAWSDAAEVRTRLGPLLLPMWSRRLAASRYGRFIKHDRFITDEHGLTEGVVARLQAGEGLYFHGYWQSAKIVAAVTPVLWDRFSFPAMTAKEAAWRARIDSTNAIAIHLRRGDYASNPKAARHHGVLSADYYRRAAELLANRVADPVFYIFSDDPAYARSQLADRLPGSTQVVETGSPHAWSDLDLMSHCQHNIIANSTYSWWSAWLNRNPDKLVVSPAPWFADQSSSGDLIPPSWQQVPR